MDLTATVFPTYHPTLSLLDRLLRLCRIEWISRKRLANCPHSAQRAQRRKQRWWRQRQKSEPHWILYLSHTHFNPPPFLTPCSPPICPPFEFSPLSHHSSQPISHRRHFFATLSHTRAETCAGTGWVAGSRHGPTRAQSRWPRAVSIRRKKRKPHSTLPRTPRSVSQR